MRRRRAVAFLVGMTTVATACREVSRANAGEKQKAELTAREGRLTRALANADAASAPGKPLAKWILPAELLEVSGLALTGDGRLLAHNDEQGKVFVIDPRRGVLLKTFTLGDRGVRADFEGIATAGSDIYLLASNGTVYQFQEGADGAAVQYKQLNSRLGRECEFEGVAIDPDSAWILLPCKNVKKKGMRDQLVIYRWHPERSDSSALSMLTIPLEQVIGPNGWKSLHPSDITIDPATGNYVLIASQEKALIELTPAGDVVRSIILPGNPRQPEGVTISSDGILIVSDEGTKGWGSITLYKWPFAQSAASQ